MENTHTAVSRTEQTGREADVTTQTDRQRDEQSAAHTLSTETARPVSLSHQIDSRYRQDAPRDKKNNNRQNGKDGDRKRERGRGKEGVKNRGARRRLADGGRDLGTDAHQNGPRIIRGILIKRSVVTHAIIQALQM